MKKEWEKLEKESESLEADLATGENNQQSEKKDLYDFFDIQKLYDKINTTAHLFFKNSFNPGLVSKNIQNKISEQRNASSLLQTTEGNKKIFFIEYLKYAIRKNPKYATLSDDVIFYKIAKKAESARLDPKAVSKELTCAEERFFQRYLLDQQEYKFKQSQQNILSFCDGIVGTNTIALYNEFKSDFQIKNSIPFKLHMDAMTIDIVTKPKVKKITDKIATRPTDDLSTIGIINFSTTNNNIPTQVNQKFEYREINSFNDIGQSEFNALPKEARGIISCNYFIDKGFSPTIAAAIGGNLWHEGGFNTLAVGDNKTDKKRNIKPVYGYSHGPMQVNRERRERMLRFNESHPFGSKNTIKDINSPTEKEMQVAQVHDYRVWLDFILLELRTNYQKVYNNMTRAGENLTKATKIFQDEYERPRASMAHFEKRLGYANKLEKHMKKDKNQQLAFINMEAEKIASRNGINNTFAAGDSRIERYPGQKLFNPGKESSDVANAMISKLPTIHKPNIFFSAGINNYHNNKHLSFNEFSSTIVSSYYNDLNNLYLNKGNKKMFVSTIPPVGNDDHKITLLNQAINNFAITHSDVKVIDIYAHIKGNQKYTFQQDNLHLATKDQYNALNSFIGLEIARLS